jgi:kynurenine formamidase
VTHPTHISDVAQCLQYLVHDWNGWSGVRNVILVGHSCGAHILSHLVFGLPTLPEGQDVSSLRSTVTRLMERTTALAFLDGIYSLRALISEYPTYRFFVDAAFGADAQAMWEAGDVFVPSATVVRAVSEELRRVRKIVVAHATGDELLTPMQGKLWVEHLHRVGLGKVVDWDETTLRGTHDGCLHHDGLGKLLYKLME